MRIKVKYVKKEVKNGKKGPFTKYGILNELDDQWYNTVEWEVKGFEHLLKVGEEWEALVTDPKWRSIKPTGSQMPAPQAQPAQPDEGLVEQMKEINAKLKRIEDLILSQNSAPAPWE